MPFSYITFLQARQQLAARLADTGMVFWVDDELKKYIIEALRTWSALTEIWNVNFPFTASPSATWYDLSRITGSPRTRTVTDSDLFTIIQYHLLEPPTGSGAWGGTSQFSLSDLQNALQRRQQEVIQISGCNLVQLGPIPTTPNTRRTVFADSTLEPQRIRFRPVGGTPQTLSREDTLAFDAFESQHLQQTQIPTAWSMVAEPPLAVDVDTAPGVSGDYDVIALQAGLIFNPPAASVIRIPDDWTWVLKWGALADLFGRDSEAADPLREAYCLKRYTDGVQLMQQSNWLLQATIGGVPVDTPSLNEMDGFAPEWETNGTAWPSLVTAGIDLVAPSPVATSVTGISTLLVGKAPIPVLDADFVQISRDTLDAILDYAQVIASLKMGGAEFLAMQDLEKRFYLAAQATNTRLANTGIFSDAMRSEGRRQEISVPRVESGQ